MYSEIRTALAELSLFEDIIQVRYCAFYCVVFSPYQELLVPRGR